MVRDGRVEVVDSELLGVAVETVWSDEGLVL